MTTVALGLALLHLLVLLDQQHPVVVLVLDDVQWIDDVSAATIRFAFRRLTDERIALVLAGRSGEAASFSEVAGMSTIEVLGVDDATSRAILSTFGDVTPVVAAQARAACGGNPLALLEWIAELCRHGEIHEPGTLWWQGDLLEAQWRCGRIDDAGRLVEQLTIDARRTGSRWAQAIAARGRGLLQRNPAALVESAELLDAAAAPFEAARSRALTGEIAKPEHYRRQLDQALDVFTSLGARPWAQRTTDLIGEPAGDDDRRSDAVASMLSKAELRVALAVARGLSNRAAADCLCLSPKTIDAHLQQIDRKLGVASRTGLALAITRTVGSTP